MFSKCVPPHLLIFGRPWIPSSFSVRRHPVRGPGPPGVSRLRLCHACAAGHSSLRLSGHLALRHSAAANPPPGICLLVTNPSHDALRAPPRPFPKDTPRRTPPNHAAPTQLCPRQKRERRANTSAHPRAHPPAHHDTTGTKRKKTSTKYTHTAKHAHSPGYSRILRFGRTCVSPRFL